MSPVHRPDQHPDVPHSPESSTQSTTRSASPVYPAGSGATAALVVTALLVLTQLYAAIPLLAPISTDLHGNATVALSTAFSLTYAAGFLIWGPVSDHYGRRRTMALALGTLTVSTVCCALAPSLPVLAALRAIQGLSASGFAPVALAYLSEALAPPRRAGAIGAMSTSFLVAGRLTARWSWAQIARLGFGVSALGMLGEALLAQSLVGLVAGSIVYVAGVALAAPAMISLYGLVSAPNRGSGMALNGFILFVGTSAGPLLATSSPTFRTLALILAGILAMALVAIAGFKALADADR